MLWSPIVKGGKEESKTNQHAHLKAIDANIKTKHGVRIEFIVNEGFLGCMNEMREEARRQTAELKCPVMRLLQIEEHLAKHVAKLK